MIRGYFDPSVAWPVPLVRVLIWLPTIQPKWSSIDFLLDTGAATTCIHPSDAIPEMGLPVADLVEPDNWDRVEQRDGIGGTAKSFVVPAYYALLQDDGHWMQMSGDIRIAEATVSNVRLPSLLGWDILQQFGIAVDWPNRTVELR